MSYSGATCEKAQFSHTPQAARISIRASQYASIGRLKWTILSWQLGIVTSRPARAFQNEDLEARRREKHPNQVYSAWSRAQVAARPNCYVEETCRWGSDSAVQYHGQMLSTRFISVLVGERAQTSIKSSGLGTLRHDPGRGIGEQPYTHTILKRCHRSFSGGSYIKAYP